MSIVRFLIYLIVLLTPLGIFSRFEIGDNISIYLNDILIMAALSFWVYYSLVLKKKIVLPRVLIPLVFFTLLAVLSLLISLSSLSSNEVIVSGLYLFRFVEYISICLLVANTFDEKSLINLKKLMIFSGLILAILGFVQVIIIPDFSSLAASGGWDPHQYRLLSTFFDPNFLGLYLSFVIAFLLVDWLEATEGFRFTRKWYLLPLLLVLGLAVILTYSRSSYLALGTTFLTLATLRWRWLLLMIPVGLIVVVSFFPRVLERFSEGVGFGTSGEARLVEWQNALQISADYPIFGIGFNTYRYVQQDYGFKSNEGAGHSGAGTDSSLLLILATTGVVGLSMFLVFLFWVFHMSLDLIKQRQNIGYALLASLLSLIIHSQFVNSLFYPWIMEWFFLLLGIAVLSNYAKNTIKRN